MSMKTNLISPAAAQTSRSARTDTRAKIIERVRAGGTSPQFSSGPAFNWALFAEENSTNNFEVTYKSQNTHEVDKPIRDTTDEISLPTTATNSHDSRDDSVFELDSHDSINEEESKALHSVLTDDNDASLLTDIVTNINDPGVGFAEGRFADASFNAGIKKKKVSFDDNNSFFEDEQSEATSPPKRRLFNCGGADLDLIEDLNVTLRQIFSPVKNAEIVVPEVSFREMVREKIFSFKGHRPSSGVAKNESEVGEESTHSGNSAIYSSKLDANGRRRSDRRRSDRKHSDRVRVGTPEFEAMLSRRRAV